MYLLETTLVIFSVVQEVFLFLVEDGILSYKLADPFLLFGFVLAKIGRAKEDIKAI